MMNNLFSIFDPAGTLMSSSWVVLVISASMLPTRLWKIKTPQMKLLMKTTNLLKKEISFTLGEKQKKSEGLFMVMTFIVILIMNSLALYPQIFSVSAHLCVTLPLSLSCWLSIVLFGWMKNTSHSLTHLVPQGTPPVLMMFMVMIELISNAIRPITLCVRLTANMIAGHILMSLVGTAMMKISYSLSPLIMALPLTLTLLEATVAFIQAYVFMTLVTLYIMEAK